MAWELTSSDHVPLRPTVEDSAKVLLEAGFEDPELPVSRGFPREPGRWSGDRLAVIDVVRATR